MVVSRETDTYIRTALIWCLMLAEFLFIKFLRLGALSRCKKTFPLLFLRPGWNLRRILLATNLALLILWSTKVWKNCACTIQSHSVIVIVWINKKRLFWFWYCWVISNECDGGSAMAEIDVLQKMWNKLFSLSAGPYKAETVVICRNAFVIQPWMLIGCNIVEFFH